MYLLTFVNMKLTKKSIYLIKKYIFLKNNPYVRSWRRWRRDVGVEFSSPPPVSTPTTGFGDAVAMCVVKQPVRRWQSCRAVVAQWRSTFWIFKKYYVGRWVRFSSSVVGMPASLLPPPQPTLFGRFPMVARDRWIQCFFRVCPSASVCECLWPRDSNMCCGC